MLLKVHPENPSDKHIRRIKEILESGGVISYPTDSVYAFGCLFDNARAVEKMVRLKGEKRKKQISHLFLKI